MHNELVHTDQPKPIKDPRIKIKQKKKTVTLTILAHDPVNMHASMQ